MDQYRYTQLSADAAGHVVRCTPAMSSDARADQVRSETATLEAALSKVGDDALM